MKYLLITLVTTFPGLFQVDNPSTSVKLFDAEGHQTTLHELTKEQGSVVVLLSSEKACGCKVADIGARLATIYGDEKAFFSVICSEKGAAAEETIKKYGDYLPGKCYFNPSKSMLDTYPIGEDATILFLSKEGNLVGLLPADLRHGSNMKTAHEIINRY